MRSGLVAVAIIALALSGCATQRSADQPPLAAGDEWVTIPPATGSNVPRRVRRSELAGQAGGTNLDVISGSALMNSVRPNGPPPNAKGP
jgi:hypothetical protein